MNTTTQSMPVNMKNLVLLPKTSIITLLKTTAHAWQMRHAKFPVTHDTIGVGDHVKIRITPTAFYKETFNSWSPELYTVERIDADAPQGKLYHLTGYRRALLRFELKKVADVQRYNGELHSVLNEVIHGAAVELPPPVIEQSPAMSHNPSQAEN